MTDHETRTNDRWHLNPIRTERGFTYLPEIPSEYGGHISVAESSAASGPHVWVRAFAPANLNDPSGPTVELPMHLTADNARRVAEQLEATVVEHYQNDGEREMTGAEAKAAVQRIRDLSAAVGPGAVYVADILNALNGTQATG